MNGNYITIRLDVMNKLTMIQLETPLVLSNHKKFTGITKK